MRGTVQCLTNDHNRRSVYPPHGNRNRITSYLGAPYTDEEAKANVGHRAIESTPGLRRTVASSLPVADGAYEPLEDTAQNLSAHLIGDPAEAACDFTETVVSLGGKHADNVSVLVADLRL